MTKAPESTDLIDAATRRWAEAATLLRCAGRAPASALTWLGPAWSGAAARGYREWAGVFEQACHRASGALASVAESLQRLTTDWPELRQHAELPSVDAGARELAAVPVPGRRTRPETKRQSPGAERKLPRPEPDRDDAAASGKPADTASPAPKHGSVNSSETVRGWIDEAVRILLEHGYRRDQIDPEAIATIIKHESGGNPTAVNRWDANAERGTPSMGLMQTIEPTFARWHLPGHDDIFNPVDNIIAGTRYAVARYGSVSRVPGLLSLAEGEGYRGY